jgi:signal transduction histidine kinase
MSDADQQELFRPFFRADRSRSRSTGGVGLGLVIVKRIVEAHDGTLGVESSSAEGTCFYCTLHPAPSPVPP